MWAVSRRTGLFIVSYVPLAAMFVVLKWHHGWDAAHLIRLGIATAAAAALMLAPASMVTITGRVARAVVCLALVAALAVAAQRSCVCDSYLNRWRDARVLPKVARLTSASTRERNRGPVSRQVAYRLNAQVSKRA